MTKFLLPLFLMVLPGWAQSVSPGREQSLFNGKDLSGWTIECRPEDRGKTFWTVEDGAILVNSIGNKDHHHVWLVSDREYGDFELRLKFQAYADSPGNSGVQIRSRYEPDAEGGGWMHGPQVDINPPQAMSWRTGLIYDETQEERRWVFPSLPDWNIPASYKPANAIFKYAGEGWNDLAIICRGSHITTVVNGIVRTDWDGASVLENEAHRKHNVGRTGHIALQLHDGDELKLRFKDIRIRELPPEKAGATALFNGKDLSNWDKYLGPSFPGHEDLAKAATPDTVFSVVEQGGEKWIRISGVVHGSLATKEAYGDYHLRLVYKWGTEVTEGRNSGLLFHSYDPFGASYWTWMGSMEFQMMHDNPGDAYTMVDEVVCEATAKETGKDNWVFTPGAERISFGQPSKRRMIKASAHVEKPLGEWNTFDLYCLGQTAVYVVNGQTVNRIEKIGIQRDGKTEPLTRGKLQLQSEGAELFVKSMTLEPITEIPARVLPK